MVKRNPATRAGLEPGLSNLFLVLHARLLNPAWFPAGVLHDAVAWLHLEGVNPFSCSAIAGLTSVVFTIVVSKATRPLPEPHVRELFEGV